MPQVSANGLSFHVNRFRTGSQEDRPVVVCIHGLAVVDSAASAFMLGFHLAKHADVITYDLRGHGRSDQPASGYTMEDHASDLFGLLDALDVEVPVHVIASSYGGAIAMVAAMRQPDRLASVSLLDGAVPVADWVDHVVTQTQDYERWVREAEAEGMSGGAATEEAVVRRAMDEVVEKHGLTPRRAQGAARRLVKLFRETTMREDLKAERVYGKEDLARVTCPVLGIYGDKSHLYNLTDALPNMLSDVRLHTIPGADHFEVLWRLEETRPLIRDFIGFPE